MSIVVTSPIHFCGVDMITVIVNLDSLDLFKELVRRAMNTWDTAPPELKTFADELIHGKALQDYSSQDTSRPLKGTMKS